MSLYTFSRIKYKIRRQHSNVKRVFSDYLARMIQQKEIIQNTLTHTCETSADLIHIEYRTRMMYTQCSSCPYLYIHTFMVEWIVKYATEKKIQICRLHSFYSFIHVFFAAWVFRSYFSAQWKVGTFPNMINWYEFVWNSGTCGRFSFSCSELRSYSTHILGTCRFSSAVQMR